VTATLVSDLKRWAKNMAAEDYTVFSTNSIFWGHEVEERDEVLLGIIERIDNWTRSQKFDATEIPVIRADLVILTILVKNCGGGQNISEEKLAYWSKKLDEPFSIADQWGFEPWAQGDKDRWQAACRNSIADLAALIKK
jgi:hypothetical protein